MLDEGDWLCLQCGTYYYIGLYPKNGWVRWPPGLIKPPYLEKALILDRSAAGFSGGKETVQSPTQQSKLPLPSNPIVSVVSWFATCDPMTLRR